MKTEAYRARQAIAARAYRSRNRDNPDYRSRKRSQNRASYFRHRHAIAARVQDYHLRRTYGLNVAAYDDLLSSQLGRCALCKGVKVGRLHVDHDHKTGRVRGLLCARCNAAVGYYETTNRKEIEKYLAQYPLAD